MIVRNPPVDGAGRTIEYQPRTAERLVEILRAQDPNPRSWQAEAAAEIERLTAERDEARRLHGKLVLDASAQLTRLQAALGPFAMLGRLLNEAGEAAWPDDVSARFLKLDDIKIRHFRAAARACEQEARTK
jgi:hypothetical protein